MEEEEQQQEDMFWQQHHGGDGRRLRRIHSMFLTSCTMFIFLVAIAIAFTIIVVPTLHTFTSHIFKPNSVKKSWDSLNLLLVLFAIFCGFLSRNNNETPNSDEDQIQSFSETTQEYAKPISETPWYEYSDRTPYYRLRSFNSYPDLRVVDDERWRFYDDTHVNGYRRQRPEEEEEEQSIKNREIDAFEKVVPSAPPLPVSPPQAPAERKKRTIKNVEGYRRPKPETGEEEQKKQSIKGIKVETFEKVAPNAPPLPASKSPVPAERKSGKSKNVNDYWCLRPETREEEKQSIRNRGVETFAKVVPSAPPLQPYPLPAPVERKSGKSNNGNGYQRLRPETGGKEEERKSIKNREMGTFEKVLPSAPPLPESLVAPAESSSGKSTNKTGSATTEFWTALKGKKKKQRNNSFENFERFGIYEFATLPPKPPPPPPPPPPPSVFHNLFSSKKSRQKKHNSASQNRVSKTEHVHRDVVANANTTLKPDKRDNFYVLEENVIAGNESPLIPIPPPPPPPFKIPAWTFRKQGDFVRIDSISSYSPERDEASTYDADEDEPPRKRSIDIDTKADTFIKSFRADLRLERINSSKEKQGLVRSNLYHSPTPEIKHEIRPSLRCEID